MTHFIQANKKKLEHFHTCIPVESEKRIQNKNHETTMPRIHKKNQKQVFHLIATSAAIAGFSALYYCVYFTCE